MEAALSTWAQQKLQYTYFPYSCLNIFHTLIQIDPTVGKKSRCHVPPSSDETAHLTDAYCMSWKYIYYALQSNIFLLIYNSCNIGSFVLQQLSVIPLSLASSSKMIIINVYFFTQSNNCTNSISMSKDTLFNPTC